MADLVERSPNPTSQEQQTLPERYGLDAMFTPRSVAVIGATSRPGTVGHSVLENLLQGKFKPKSICRQREPSGSAGTQNLRQHSRRPWTRGLGYSCHSGSDRPADHWRVCRCGHQVGDRHFGWIQGARAGRRCPRRPNPRTVAAQFHALDWPQLPGHYEPDDRVKCHFRQGRAPGRQCRFPESKRSASGGDPRLERSRTSWVQRHRLYWLDAGCWVGGICSTTLAMIRAPRAS